MISELVIRNFLQVRVADVGKSAMQGQARFSQPDLFYLQ